MVGFARCAAVVAELIRTAWTAEARPANAKNGQRFWVSKGLNSKQTGGFSRSTREAAYNLIAADPSRFGLREIGSGRGAFFVAAESAAVPPPDADLNPEQEMLF